MLGVVVVYLGLIAAFLGGVSFLRPLSFLAIRTRRRAALVLALSFIVGAHSLTSLRPRTSSVSSTPSGSRPQKRRCIAPLSSCRLTKLSCFAC